MLPSDLFHHCPRCGAAGHAGAVPFRCAACGLVLYFNPAVAAAAWVYDAAGHVLMIRRARDPARGKLAIPGGFIDPGETADAALRREIREEVGLEVEGVAYLTSFPNRYHYKDVTYPVLDLVFTARAVAPESARPLDGVSGIEWRRPADVAPDEVAFPSIVESLRLLGG